MSMIGKQTLITKENTPPLIKLSSGSGRWEVMLNAYSGEMEGIISSKLF